MSMKIEITVKVCDSNRTSYKDPKGYESVELFCEDEKELLPIVDGVTSALVRVVATKYRAEVEQERLDVSESET